MPAAALRSAGSVERGGRKSAALPVPPNVGGRFSVLSVQAWLDGWDELGFRRALGAL